MRNQKIHLITSTSETENQKDPCHKWYMRIQKPERTHASVSHAWMIDSNLILNPIHCLLLLCIIEPFEKTVNPKPILNLSDCTITPVTSQWVECINKLDMLWNLNHILNRITYFLKVNPCLTWHAIQSYTTCKWCPLFSWQMKVLITIIRPEKVASMQEKGNVAHQAEFTIKIEHIQKNKVATSTTQTCNQHAAHLCPYLSPTTPFVKSCQSPDCESSAILAKQPTKYIAYAS